LVQLTANVRDWLPVIDAKWAATAAAGREVGIESGAPLDARTRELTGAARNRSLNDGGVAHLEWPGPDRG